jgi:CheY-like chemotaxis protein
MLILLVDDDAEDREVFAEAVRLIDPSITCILIKSCEESLTTLDELDELPAYIFLDINMPGMNGIKCLEEIRKRKAFKDIQVIMYSTSSNPKEMNSSTTLGANGYLIKPSNFGELVRALKLLIGFQGMGKKSL